MTHTQVKGFINNKIIKAKLYGLKRDIDNIASKGKFGMGLNNA